MSKTFTLGTGILAMTLLAASGFALAADEAPASPSAGKSMHHRYDPVAHTQRRLDDLEKKLNLKDQQKSAWQTYADSAIARAKERTAKMEEYRSHRGEARAEMDTAARLEKMSQKMRERADEMQKVAQDTRALEDVLSPEQKTVFDLFWKAHYHHKMEHRPKA